MKLSWISETLVTVWIFIHTVTGEVLITNPPPKKVTAKRGEDVSFSCKVDLKPHLNKDHLKIKWKHNGHYISIHNKSDQYIEEDRGQTLRIRRVKGTDGGVYNCIVSVGLKRDLASARLIVREPPEAPRDVSVMSCLGNSVELIWTAGSDGGAKITSYHVQFNTSDNPLNWNNYYDTIPGEVETIHLNLAPWGTYNFRLLAKNDVDFSEPSLPTKTECTTTPTRPGGNPKNVRTLTFKPGKLIVTWEPMPRLLHYGPGFQYAIFWRRKGSTYWNKNMVKDSGASRWEVEPMPRLLHYGPGFQYAIFWRRKGSTYWNKNMVKDSGASRWEVEVNDTYGLYEIKVKAENQMGESRQPAFIFLGHSGEGEPKVIPKDFRLDPTKKMEPHKAHFIWEAVDTSEMKILGEFKGYRLRYWKSSEGRHKLKEVDINVDETDHDKMDIRASIDNLPAYTALRAQVSVINRHFTGPPSQIIDFFTPEGVPGPVRELHIDAHGAEYALLKWLPPEEPNVPGPVRELHIDAHGAEYALLKWLPPEEPNGKLLGYDIGYQKITNEEMGKIRPLHPQIHNPETLGAKITGLASNHMYRFYVWARTHTGRGEPAYLDVKTEDGSAPDKPLPKFTTLDQTSVNITWTPFPLLDVTYVLEYRPTGYGHWSIANPEWGKSWMVINDLTPNTEYEVRLVAKNKYGDTASSTLYRVKTQPVKGHDAHLYQQDDSSVFRGSSGSYSLHGSSLLQITSSRTFFLLIHSLGSFLMVYTIFH